MAEPAAENLPKPDGPLVAAALEAYGARLKKLEDQETTPLSKLQKRASFLALMIGIILSSFSLFDTFWSKPKESLMRETEEFNKAVNAVANLRQSMVQIRYQHNHPQMYFEMNSMVTPQILANIQYARALLPKLGENAGIPQLIVLISEAMNIYDWPSATVLVERAVKDKRAVPTMQSEAQRYKARLMFMTDKLPEGRKAYEEALGVLKTESAFGINGVRAFIVADWALAEYAKGECVAAAARVAQFSELMKDTQMPQPNRIGLISTLKAQLTQLQGVDTRCPRSTALDGLMPS